MSGQRKEAFRAYFSALVAEGAITPEQGALECGAAVLKAVREDYTALAVEMARPRAAALMDRLADLVRGGRGKIN